MTIHFIENKNTSSLPLILIHAFPLNRWMWKHQVEGLEDCIRVIAPDIPGFGESERLMEPPSMRAYVKSLLNFLNSKEMEKAIFGGCSMGGYILFELWRYAPERVAGFILCDTRAEADTQEMRQNRKKSIEDVRANGTAKLTETMLPKLISPATVQTQDDLMNDLRNIILNTDKEGIADAQQALADRPDSLETLKTIIVPTLILVGEDDILTPPDVAGFMQERIPNSNLEIIPNAGHLSPLEQPERTNEAIRTFLLESGLI